MRQAVLIEFQGQLPGVDANLHPPSAEVSLDAQRGHSQRGIAQALIDLAGAGRSRALQKLAGVLALMISASSGPMFLKAWGRVVGM